MYYNGFERRMDAYKKQLGISPEAELDLTASI